MVAYQVMIEGVFLEAPSISQRCGFHSTFYLRANNAPNAIHRVAQFLDERLLAHGISATTGGPYRTYFWVSNIWEITDDKFTQNANKDHGFSFFRIGRLEAFYLSFRRFFFLRFRPWLLVSRAKGVEQRD